MGQDGDLDRSWAAGAAEGEIEDDGSLGIAVTGVLGM